MLRQAQIRRDQHSTDAVDYPDVAQTVCAAVLGAPDTVGVLVCGTGQELVAVTSVDRLPVGDGVPGPVTQRLQAAYEAVVRGTTDAHPKWRSAIS